MLVRLFSDTATISSNCAPQAKRNTLGSLNVLKGTNSLQMRYRYMAFCVFNFRSYLYSLTMKILYGVCRRRNGHAMRSRVILDYLAQEGHDVQIMASSRACDYLSQRFSGVHRIHGFHMVTEENRMRKDKPFGKISLKARLPSRANCFLFFLLSRALSQRW